MTENPKFHPPNFYGTDDLAMDLEKEETRGCVRGIGYGSSPSNYAPRYRQHASLQTVERLLHELNQKVDAMRSPGYQGQPIASSPHDTESLEGLTVASPSQTIRRGSTASVDGPAKQ
jgi:hypothetical protein